MKKIKAVDLFCGGGGLSQGLSEAGFDIKAAYDWWEPALNFYNHNIKGHSAYKLDLLDVHLAVKTISKWHPDIIVGGPPCQDFSSAGKRDENGGRANLTLSYAEIVKQVSPKYFLMENVDRALKSRTLAKAREIFRDAGYNLSIAVLDASLCGAPQRRKRTIIVGTKDHPSNIMIPLYMDAQAKKPMTIRDYVGESFGIDFYYRHPRSYARRGVFSIDEPSPTVRGVNRPVPRGYPGHPGDAAPVDDNLRPLTTKERSILQTFPAEWEMIGTKHEVEQIIGNAVPVKLGTFVGKAIISYLSSAKLREVIDRRALDWSSNEEPYLQKSERDDIEE